MRFFLIYISLFLISGFTEFTQEITVPKIEHMNIDGIQPKYNILSVDGDQQSTIRFRLCDKTHILNTITFQTETRFPFILLLVTEGSTVNKHGKNIVFNPFKPSVFFMGHCQTVQNQIRRCIF